MIDNTKDDLTINASSRFLLPPLFLLPQYFFVLHCFSPPNFSLLHGFSLNMVIKLMNY